MASKRAVRRLAFKVSTPRSDYGPQERWQHSARSLELTEKAGLLAARALEEHLLDSLLLRGWLDEPQRDAGIRLKEDYYDAGLEEHVVGSYSPIRRSFSFFGSGNDRTDAQEAAYQRWRDAVKEIPSACTEITLSVSCHEIPPTLRQMPLLQQGLQILIRHYGLKK